MSQLRCVVPGYAHHIYQRGVRKEPLFHEDSDFLVYLQVLKEAGCEHGMCIWCYALMTNHIHLLAVPRTEKSISKALHQAHTAYAMYFNTKYLFSGHVWQGRPNISLTDDAYMWAVARYIERNPVRAGIVRRAEQYLWSSAQAHCGLRDDNLLSKDFPPAGVIPNWSEWLQIEHSEQERNAIRSHLSTGRAWCKPETLTKLEAITGRNLQLHKPGRPKKNPGQTGEFPLF